MKLKLVIMYLCLFVSIGINAQKLFQKEDVKLIELNERVTFYHVDDRHQLTDDTMFFVQPNFQVYPYWSSYSKNGKNYIVLTYPDFKKGYEGEQEVNLLENTSNIEDIKNNATYHSLYPRNGKRLMIEESVFNNLKKTNLYDRTFGLETGILNVPFKLRPAIDSANFRLTTDVALGPYIGINYRLSERNPYFLTLPFNAGLTLININDNTTNTSLDINEEGVKPGITVSTGLIARFDEFNIGIVVGKDWVSDVGDDWIYHGRYWWSFAIGYSFLSNSNK